GRRLRADAGRPQGGAGDQRHHRDPLLRAARAAGRDCGHGREILVLMQSSKAGIRLIAHDTLGSTNAEALALARAGECGPLWVTAARQTAGRGRRGNIWTSEPGNLYA